MNEKYKAQRAYTERNAGNCQDCGVKLKSIGTKRCVDCHWINCRGENHYLWKGGRTIRDGYNRVRLERGVCEDVHYATEHRLLWEQSHSMSVPDNCDVHHINGNRCDNRPWNLLLMPHAEHTRLHKTGKCHMTGDHGIKEY